MKMVWLNASLKVLQYCMDAFIKFHCRAQIHVMPSLSFTAELEYMDAFIKFHCEPRNFCCSEVSHYNVNFSELTNLTDTFNGVTKIKYIWIQRNITTSNVPEGIML